MRSLSSNFYLGALAISDIVYSMILLFDWFLLMGINLKENYLYWLYYFVDFLNFFSEFLNVWLIVAFTIERYIVTKYPPLRRSWCTVKRAKIVVVTLMGPAILRSILHIFFYFRILHYRNVVSFKYYINIYDLYKHLKFDVEKEAIRTRIIIDSIIIFIIPALVIVICNTLIVYHIYQQNRVRKTLITACDSSNEKTQICSNKMFQQKITKMLILVSSIFVILKLATYCYHFIISWIHVNESVMMTIFMMTSLLETAHYSINFVLYCVTGQTFRRELIRMFTKCTNKYKK